MRPPLALGVVLMASACQEVAPAVGPIREVAIVTEWWGAVESTLQATLQRRINTPQPEPEFRLRVFTNDQFLTYSRFRTLLLVGTTADTLIRTVLRHRVESLPGGRHGLFRIPNAWAAHQELLVFAASGPESLVCGLREYSDRLRGTVRSIVLRHTARALYHNGHNLRAEDSLLSEYDLRLEIPREWRLRQEHAVERFVYIFGHYPDRGVSVYWENSERELRLEELLLLRDSLAARFYDGDQVQRDHVVVDTVPFLSHSAVRVSGIWQNEASTIGGPFISYAFNHDERFYLLDGIVYNPGRKKLDHLYQVEAILTSFAPR